MLTAKTDELQKEEGNWVKQGGKLFEAGAEEGLRVHRPRFSIVFNPWCPQAVVNLSAALTDMLGARCPAAAPSPPSLKHTCSHTNPTPGTLTCPPFPHTTVGAHIDPQVPIRAAAGKLVWKKPSVTPA